jgi:hypothetical protein
LRSNLVLALFLVVPAYVYGQQGDAHSPSTDSAKAASEGEQASGQSAGEQSKGSEPNQDNNQSPEERANQAVPPSERQPKRILGIMPNYRAVSAGAIPPPPTPKQAFMIATRNSFDYSSFVFVGMTSLFAEGSNAHPQLGKGLTGYGRYYWRGYLDKTDGNYLVIFALPSVLHQDERYFAMGHKGGVLKRMAYSASRILITPDYHGHQTFNASEVFGRAMAQGISLSYYPSHDRTAGALAVKYGWAMFRDATTQMFREFWPDIAVHVLHRKQ